ncbi:MAG: F-type H+-transporting ATPase subunit epsilon [Actinomycetota bacterium]|jgi:F-type H+-transporting ATPase subunit epsilon|nr:F-type H+-transporting ATPase subunit epsilon [Actinomycetota bacterium]
MDVSIVAADRKVWQGDAELVIARSPEGEFGIMRGHIPFLAALVPGRVTVVNGQTRETFLVTGGFLEASGPMSDEYHVIILADDAEEIGEVDDAELKRRLDEIKQRASDEREGEMSDAALRASLAAGERASGDYSSR